MSESAIQSEMKMALKDAGFFALSTSTYKRLRKGAVEKGIPDLLVTHKDYPKGLWLGLEVKTSTGKPSDTQNTLWEYGRIEIVTTVDEALREALARLKERAA